MSTAEVFDIVPADPETERDDVLTYIRSGELSDGVDLMSEAEVERVLLRITLRLGLDPLLSDRPVRTITTRDGRRVLYITAKGTDALAAKHRITHETIEKPTFYDFDGVKLFSARVRAKDPNGREAESTGTVPFPASRDPQEVGDAHMHSETKARRRSTLVVLGIGFHDESELAGVITGSSKSRRVAAPAADSQFAKRETPVAEPSEPEPTALDRLRDDLDQHGATVALEQALAIWNDHKREIPIEDVGRASNIVRERLAVPMSSSAFGNAIRLAEQCEKSPALRAIRTALAKCTTPGELVATWDALAPDLASLAAADPYSHHFATHEVFFDAVRRFEPGAPHPTATFKKMRAAVATTTPSGADEKPTGETRAAPKPAPSITDGPVMKFTRRPQF